MLFGVRLRSLFTSRWLALLWAVLVILTAIQFVGVSDEPDRHDSSNAVPPADSLTPEQRAALVNAL